MGEWEGPQGLMASVIYIYIYTMVDNLTGGTIGGGGGGSVAVNIIGSVINSMGTSKTVISGLVYSLEDSAEAL